MDNILKVGFGREKITPTMEVYISGGGNPKRISTGILDDLYITCIAITDSADRTVLVFTEDMQQVSSPFIDPGVEGVVEATGVAKENIIIAATHTHSAPGQHLGRHNITPFQEIYTKGMIQAAVAAMKDRSAAVVSAGTTHAKGLVFVRHYLLENGTFAGSAYGDFKSAPIKGQVYEAKDIVQMIRFDREGKKAVLMMNLGAHATFNGNIKLTNISADFPGPTREHIEANSDCLVAYFLGAAGDQVPRSLYEPIDHGLDYIGYGQKLGQYVLDAQPSMIPAQAGDLQLRRWTLTAKANKNDMDRLAQAEEVYDAFVEGSYKLANPLVKEYGFVSPYEARAICIHSKQGETRDVQLAVLTFGDVAMTFGAFEMFGDNGVDIREKSPYSTTFVVSQAMATNDYIPAPIGFKLRCYEAYSSHYAPGTAERIAEDYIRVLTELKNN
ncbi:MAG: neutral/alkaline non-lysosomal ceramidase N-terminal domain-containing protein [Oscillospiraceae bacterium]|nr:neutral/alkaline non-lysosomal ceramidase N-terminal domain-containing protein [Oscillospiraceae bacterium]